MRKHLIISIIIIILGVISLSAQNSKSVPVGTVINSILPPEVFLKENGHENWMLLNGQELITESKLMKTLEKYKIQDLLVEHQLPDVRGRFIRSMNHQGGADPDSNRIVGKPQNDKTRAPRNKNFNPIHSVANQKTIEFSKLLEMKKKTTMGNNWYVANEFLYYSMNDLNKPNKEGYLLTTNIRPYNITAGGKKLNNNADVHNQVLRQRMGVSTLKERTNINDILFAADDETRPKNIALYTYIKIN